MQRTNASNRDAVQATKDYELALYFARHNMPMSRKSYWRLTERLPGQITGLPMSRGILTATDGVLCHIELGDGRLFTGHLHHFEPDDKEVDVNNIRHGRPAASKSQKKINKIEYEYQ